MELESQTTDLYPAKPEKMFRGHWSAHLLMILAMLQVTGHFINVYHLKLLKPLPIIILLLLTDRKTGQDKLFFAGLLSSLGGDLCLMAESIFMFELGTFLFLIAHVLYICAFVYDISEKKLRKLKKKRHITLISFISFIITLLVFNLNELWDKTPNFTLFFIYGVVLSVMAITASLRTNNDASYFLILFGSLMFGVSDNTLAYFKFNHIHSEAAAAFIMATYYTAQCLISEGIRMKSLNS